MGIIIRQSVRSTVISYVGVALGFMVTIWLYPQILTVEQYGLTRVLISMAVVSTQFAGLGINNTIVRYFPYFKDEERNHHGFLFFATVIPLIGFALLGLALYFGQDFIISYYRDESALLTDYYLWIIPLGGFMLFFTVISNVVKVLHNITVASFLNEVFLRILVVAALLLYLSGLISFPEFIILFVLNYGIVLVLLLGYLLRYHGISFRPDFYFLNRRLLKSILKYSTFAFWGGISSIAVANIDVLMLSALAGLDDTGVYAIAFYIGSAITITRTSIYNISSPVIADAFKRNDYALIEDIYKRSSLNQLIGGGLVFCGVLINIDNLMSLLPAAYTGGSMVIIIIGAAKLFDMTTGLNGAIILNSRHYRFDLYSMVMLIVITITLNYYLIPPYGILGAAVGTASAVVLYNLLKVVLVALTLRMQPFALSMLGICLIGTTGVFLSFQVGEIMNTYTDILIRSMLFSIFYITAVYLSGISDNFNGLVEGVFKRLKSYL